MRPRGERIADHSRVVGWSGWAPSVAARLFIGQAAGFCMVEEEIKKITAAARVAPICERAKAASADGRRCGRSSVGVPFWEATHEEFDQFCDPCKERARLFHRRHELKKKRGGLMAALLRSWSKWQSEAAASA